MFVDISFRWFNDNHIFKNDRIDKMFVKLHLNKHLILWINSAAHNEYESIVLYRSKMTGTKGGSTIDVLALLWPVWQVFVGENTVNVLYLGLHDI